MLKTFFSFCLITLGLIIISGCSNVKPQTDFSNQMYVHPELGEPITPINIEWKTYKIGETNYVGLPFNQFVPYQVQQRELLRYIQKSNNALCYYRQGLYESRCTGYNKELTKEEEE